jgi:hypothetical protein
MGPELNPQYQERRRKGRREERERGREEQGEGHTCLVTDTSQSSATLPVLLFFKCNELYMK